MVLFSVRLGDESVSNLVKVIILIVLGVLLVSAAQYLPALGDLASLLPVESRAEAGVGLRWLDGLGALAVGAAAAIGVGLVKNTQQGEEGHHE
ncbi:MAG: hypothetical protein AA931_04140 [Peptococcaceae bacterium 1109]|jgi:hypothetical protein|nr:MAG: hypothetical protein AA931_04140 [Peptococcaceae bacterium 1109]